MHLQFIMSFSLFNFEIIVLEPLSPQQCGLQLDLACDFFRSQFGFQKTFSMKSTNRQTEKNQVPICENSKFEHFPNCKVVGQVDKPSRIRYARQDRANGAMYYFLIEVYRNCILLILGRLTCNFTNSRNSLRHGYN